MSSHSPGTALHIAAAMHLLFACRHLSQPSWLCFTMYKACLLAHPSPGRGMPLQVPSRGMIGFKSLFVNLTRGEGIMARAFLRYDAYRGPLEGVRKGGWQGAVGRWL